MAAAERHGTRPRLIWYTSAPAPYRFPVWEELGRRFDLTVVTCESLPPERQWQLPEAEDFTHVAADLRPVGRGALRVYRGQAPDLVTADTVAVIITGWASPALRKVQRLALERGVPVLSFYESTRQSQYFPFGPIESLRRKTLQASDGVLVPGPAARDAVVASDVDDERITIVGNTIDAGRYLAIAERRAKEPRPGHTFTYVGQPIRRKNVPGLIAAFDRVARPEDELLLAGFSDPPKPIARAIDSVRTGRVTVEGFVDREEYDALLERTDTLVLPSTREVWGMVAQEAQLAGCHVVVSSRCGVAPSIEADPGVWVSEPDPESLAAALGASRDAWTGPLRSPQPEITRASYFADRTAAAIDAAHDRRAS